MEDKNCLVFAIIQFLKKESSSPQLSEESQESIGVALQCLETAYGIDANDESLKAKYPLPGSLEEIFSAHVQGRRLSQPVQIPQDVEEAEKYKQQGNEKMKAELYSEAVDLYSKAIERNRSNAVYYCNRAAAYSKMSNHRAAIDDCDRALQIDPNYSKAFGRKGIAYGMLNNHAQAKECYEQALKLDPENASYKTNLDISEQKLREAGPAGGGGGGLPGAPGGLPGGMGGGMDFGAFLNNPAIMNMATQMMSNPQMQNMMSSMFQQSQEGGGGGGGISNLLQAGQQLAAQMQQANPDLVEQLRQQHRQGTPPDEEEKQ